LLVDAWPGGGSGNPSSLTPLGDGRAVFAATDPVHNAEPWVTDGTAAGTRLVLDVNADNSGFGASYPGGFAPLGDGRALFAASDPEHGNEPWVTDGTPEGTRLLETTPGPDGSYLSGAFVALGDGRALFGMSDPDRGSELWVTDGTQGGTALVADINPGPNGSFPGAPSGAPPAMFPLGDGRAVFAAEDGANGRELWVSDGTAAGTYLLADLWPGTFNPYPGSGDYPGSSSPSNFVALGPGRILFTASDGDRGTELWITDGTADGTRIVADLWAGTTIPYPGASPTAAGSRPGSILALGDGRAVFAAEDGEHGRELWITDGTEAGTRLVADLWEGGGSGNPGGVSYSYPPPPYGPPYGPPGGPGGPSGPGGIFALGDGRALFSGTDPLRGTELWITDGTPAGTRLVEDINSNAQGFASSVPSHFAALDDGRVVFAADDGANGVEPWITDGTAEGTRLLHDINPGAAGSGASGFARVSGAPAAEVPEPSPPADGWLVA
jgi:ELWxxDGT repeat protein